MQHPPTDVAPNLTMTYETVMGLTETLSPVLWGVKSYQLEADTHDSYDDDFGFMVAGYASYFFNKTTLAPDVSDPWRFRFFVTELQGIINDNFLLFPDWRVTTVLQNGRFCVNIFNAEWGDFAHGASGCECEARGQAFNMAYRKLVKAGRAELHKTIWR